VLVIDRWPSQPWIAWSLPRRSVKTRGSLILSHHFLLRFMNLESRDKWLQFVLRKIVPAPPRQIWSTMLKRQIFLDQFFERFQHLCGRFRHLLFPSGRRLPEHPIHRSPADLEHLRDVGRPHALRLQFPHPRGLYQRRPSFVDAGGLRLDNNSIRPRQRSPSPPRGKIAARAKRCYLPFGSGRGAAAWTVGFFGAA
jgi:hypothetical protein